MNRTLLICTPSYFRRGGIERILLDLHQGLPALGFAVVLGLAKGARFHRPELYQHENPDFDCVEIDGSSGTRLGRLRGLRQALIRVRPDVVIVDRLFDAYDAVGTLKLAGHGPRLATMVRAYEPECIADLAAYSGLADICIADGKLIAAAVQAFAGIAADRVVSIPGGVAPASRLAAGPGRATPLRLGYVGRLENHQKRVFDLVDVLALARQAGVRFTCRIVGAGSDEAELRRRVGDRGLAELVTIEGWLATEDLYERVYPELDVFLHCAAWEGTTMAPREAMAHGVVPVISEFVGCRAEGLFRDGETALTFPVGDAGAASRHLHRLQTEPDTWRRLSRAAMQSQDGIYSSRGAVVAWASALEAACERPPVLGTLPHWPFPAAGRLDRLLSARGAEWLRRLTKRVAPHAEPGGEWPHCSGLVDPRELQRIAAYPALAEAGLARQVPLLDASGRAPL